MSAMRKKIAFQHFDAMVSWPGGPGFKKQNPPCQFKYRAGFQGIEYD
jgi:hypothetical protein